MSSQERSFHQQPKKVRSRTAIWHDILKDQHYLLKKDDGKIKEVFKNGKYLPSFNPQISGFANAKQRMQYATNHEEFSAERPKSLQINQKQMFYTPQQDKYDGYTQQPSPKSPPYFNIMNNPKLRDLKESMIQIKPQGIEKYLKSDNNQNVYNPPIENCSFISGTIKNYQENINRNTVTKLDYNRQQTIIRKRINQSLSDSKANKISQSPKNPPQQFKIINGKILTIPNQSILMKQKQKQQNEVLKASQVTPIKSGNVSFTYNPREKTFTGNNSIFDRKQSDLSALFGNTANSMLENSFQNSKQFSKKNLSKHWKERSMDSTFHTNINGQSNLQFSDQLNVSQARYNQKVRSKNNKSQYLQNENSSENLLNNSRYEEYQEIKRSNSNYNISRILNNSSQYLTKTFSKLEIIPDEEPQVLKTSQSFIQKMEQNKYNKEATQYKVKEQPLRISTKGRFPQSRAVSPGEMYLKERLKQKQIEMQNMEQQQQQNQFNIYSKNNLRRKQYSLQEQK
ncbi:hypothetical protein TTHERM_01262900 (macronuclear) [Tetrahymena thermophila SB210]|uniref:Uncharacterized protein n=1 Tax=Tetrahymena thermophila (strain SB210) TaxID=312017 RepID=Q24DD7_TETTS|nr:hypothetical protein TTHERM_01262900 [Tetrahymena thermophila SB210]EAS05804.2 hypothetical protein TTHERM_01262900 [Tetrahymena thermophila SB210]|eukprot:XP_001026049.2 hypothetical protein TTHERM_01262900 [Tetrahymena thermophila SB210]